MLKFSNAYLFWLLLIAVVWFGVTVLQWIQKRNKLQKLFNESVIEKVVPHYSFGKYFFRIILITLAIIFIIITLARPKFGAKVQMLKSVGVDMVIAMDVSNSMMAQDISPNRLERTKDAISAFLDKLNGDRVAFVAFAGKADIIVEMTIDYAAVKNSVSVASPDMFATQGTSMSEALRVSLLAFPEDLKSAGAIILLTDGEDHEGAIEEQLNQCNKKGITVYTVAIGTEKGGPIPFYDHTGVLKGYKTDASNQPVITAANRALLQDMATKGKGKFYAEDDPLTSLLAIQKELSVLEKTAYENKNEDGLAEQFQWILILVIFILVLEVFYSNKKGRTLKKIDL